MEGGGRPVDGDKTRDFVFVKMKQKDVDFMKSSIQHLRQQASLGWSSTYATAPWVLVMALPFVSFLFTVVLRSSLASLALSSILSFLLFMRIYATQVQFIAKIAKLKHKVTRYHDRVERMQDEIEAGGQELKESVREQLRLNEFSTLLQERLAELEREVKRTRFASLREIEKELSAKDTPTTTLKVQQTLKAKSFDEQAMTPQHFKHRKRGMTQIIKYIPCEEENAGEENEGDDDVDDHEEDEDEEDDDDEEEMDGVAGDGSDDEHAPAEKTEEEVGRAKEAERDDDDERTKAKDKKEEEEREYYAFLQRMDALRKRDQRLMRERNEEDYSADIAAARELRPDWRDDIDESEDGSVRVQMTTGDFSSEEDVDESNMYSSDDVSQLGSQPTTVLHRSRSSRDTDEVKALRRRLEFVEDMQRKRDAEYSAEAQETSKKGKSGSSKLRPQASRVTIHLASSASTSALDHSTLSVRPLTSSNSCIPTFASKSSTSPRADKSGAAHSTQAAPPPPPPPPPPLAASPSSRFKFRFFPHMPRRHSSNSTAQLAASGHSTPTSLPTSPLLTSNTTPPAGASPPASPRGLSTSSPTHTRPFSLRKRGDSSSPPPLVSGGSGIQGSGGSSPPNKPKRGSMLLSLLPFSHEKDREKDKDKERGRESGNDDEQDDDDSSDEGGNGEGGSHTKRKKHHNPFALRRMKSKEDERMISKREEKEKVKGEKEKEKKRAKEEKERVKEEKEEAKEKGKEEREPKKRLVDGVRRLYHRRTRSAAAGEIEKDL